MDWYDIEDILYDGTKEEIEKLRCPDCGGNISFSCSIKYKRFVLKCDSCGYLSISNGFLKEPNCYKFFGEKSTFSNSKC